MGRHGPATPPPVQADAGQAGARRSPTVTAGCSSRSGTASAASCSATATRSSWPAARNGRSPATSRSCSTRSVRALPATLRRRRRDRDRRPRGRGLDFDALLQRIHPAESRVRRLAGETPASFVAFDLLALGDEVLLDRPLHERRERLDRGAAEPMPPVHLTPASTATARPPRTGSGASRAPASTASSPRRLDDPYQPDKRALIKVKHERTADCVVAGYRIHKDGEGVGSLLLGLYDDQDQLQHVGVAAAFTVKFRRGAASSCSSRSPRGPPTTHPWRDWAEWQQQDVSRKPGATSRWNAGKDLSWIPVRTSADDGAGRRGHVRPAREPPVPPRRLVPPLAPRPPAVDLPLRPARGRRPGPLRRGGRRGSGAKRLSEEHRRGSSQS